MFQHIVRLNNVISKEDRVFEKDLLSNLFKIFLISQKSFNQGYDSIIHMQDFLMNKVNPESEYLSPIEIVTKENAEFITKNYRK